MDCIRYPQWAPRVLVEEHKRRSNLNQWRQLRSGKPDILLQLITHAAMARVWPTLEKHLAPKVGPHMLNAIEVAESSEHALYEDTRAYLFDPRYNPWWVPEEFFFSWWGEFLGRVEADAKPVAPLDSLAKGERSRMFSEASAKAIEFAELIERLGAPAVHKSDESRYLDPHSSWFNPDMGYMLSMIAGSLNRSVSPENDQYSERFFDAAHVVGKTALGRIQLSHIVRALADVWEDESQKLPYVHAAKSDNPNLVSFVRRIHEYVWETSQRHMYEQISALSEAIFGERISADRIRLLCRGTDGNLPSTLPF